VDIAAHDHDKAMDPIGRMLEIQRARPLCVAPEPVSVSSMVAIDAVE
jgi:hypothetical protein